MTALDELRAALDEERQLRRSWIPTSRVTATDAALARVEAELADADIEVALWRAVGGPRRTKIVTQECREHPERRAENVTHAARALEEADAEEAELRKRPTLEQAVEALNTEHWYDAESYETALRAIRALYGEAES